MGFNRRVYRRQELLGLVKRVYHKVKSFIAIDESGDHVRFVHTRKIVEIPCNVKNKRRRRVINHGYFVEWRVI